MTKVERADAARNRRAILEAADKLFATAPVPSSVSMDDIARAAGVGKGTLFRRFGDRTGLIRALYATRLGPLRERIESGPPPLGPATPPRERIAAVLNEIAVVKLDNLHLTSAIEDATSGLTGSHYSRPDYRDTHVLLTQLIGKHTKSRQAAWTAHILLGAVRADLLRHLADVEGLTTRQIRTHLNALIDTLVPA